MTELNIFPHSLKHQIDLKVSDLDGTMGHGNISPASARSIHEFLMADYNNRFIGASGRAAFSTRDELIRVGLGEFLDTRIDIIGFNGGYATHNGEVILDRPLNPELVSRIRENCLKHNKNALFYGTSVMYVTEATKQFRLVADMMGYELVEGIPENETCYVIDLLKWPDEDFETLEQIWGTADLRANQGRKMFFGHSSVGDPNMQWLEIVPPNVDKVYPMIEIMEQLGISPQRTFVIGDHVNDKGMVSLDGVVGVAMGNAPVQLKEVAKFVTKPVREEGFSYASKYLIL
ncbi:HAD hydrolase family protein [Candidatus Woesearchaeota archaeon]|nr:HAD hydrolase family protein [Candidatus Woesearchaeota archaeon]